MNRAIRFGLLVGLGLLGTFAFLLGAEPFEVTGRNPIGERVGGSLAVAVWCAACQFWFARQDARAGRKSWPGAAAMLLGLTAAGLAVIAIEGSEQWRYFSGPALLAGGIGTAFGMVMGRRAGTGATD